MRGSCILSGVPATRPAPLAARFEAPRKGPRA